MRRTRFAWVPVAAGLLAAGWSGYDETVDGLRLAVGEIAPVADPAAPTPVSVTVSNGTATPFRGSVALRDFVDDWKAVGPDTAAVALAPATATNLSFRIASGPFVFDALYPVHAHLSRDGAPGAAVHAVRIFEVKRPAAPRTAVAAAPEALRPEADASLPLWLSRTHRFGWALDGGATGGQPSGWTGSDPDTSSGLSIDAVNVGGSREAMGMHVPYRNGTGRCWVEWTVDLPPASPAVLTFATALHHSGETEKQRSDGIRYRVLVADTAASNDWKTLHEDFTDTRTWKDGRADLAAFAGRRILIRLESDPGPKRNTAFDHSWWAEPTLVTGRGGPTSRKAGAPTPESTQAAVARARSLLGGTAKPDGRTAFLLEASAASKKAAVVVEPGPQGLLDGLVAFAVEGGGAAAFRGFEIDVDDAPVGRFPSPFAFRGVETSARFGRVRTVLSYARGGEAFDVTLTVRAEGPALRVSASCPRMITRFRVGPWDRTAPRIYWGHGFCVSDPKPFQQGFGGHNLASSHIAAEFDGLAVLQAFDNPPDHLRVDPPARVYALQSHHDATLTLLPGRAAMDCAIAYRPLDPRKPAAGHADLAGRMCFDIWGGRYADIATNMTRMLRYGLSDSFLTLHVWQRWGYDYRLPDIWPPNPQYGTLDDLRQVGAVCRAAGVPWGLHDNYIDFYPDAAEYSYRSIYFTPDGRPNRAWYNEGRDALSYKWRPDAILPFVKRNTKLIRDGVGATHSFVDVFTSQGCVDTWDHDGRRHPSTGTRRHWGEAFATIRDILGGNAPTTSEAGHDQLIGWLDGADCQWLRLTSERPALHSIFLECGSWTRVPWMDAVHHHRFNLHGAGYSVRFEGGLGRAAHGIHSDEYLACEMLAGHSLMVDAGSWGAPAVRKYWLLQDIIRSLARRDLVSHAFDGARRDRQRVEWDNGAVVHVNQGADDWAVAGAVLPPNGWRAVSGTVTASVERIAGRVVERASAPGAGYCNARTAPLEGERRRMSIRPRLEAASAAGGKLAYTMVWDCKSRPGKNNAVFVHFAKEEGPSGFGETVWQDDFKPVPPAEEWKGEVRFDRTVPIPAGLAGRFRVMVGLYDKHSRKPLLGEDDGEGRIWIGTLLVGRGADGALASVSPEPPKGAGGLPPWMNPEGTKTDFAWTVTDGAFRIERAKDGLRLIPLPGCEPFDIVLRLAHLPGAPGAVSAVLAEPADPAAKAKPAEFKTANGMLALRHDGESFGYRIVTGGAK
ncbi:MAG: hypothetical protein FJ221_00470 [Lentisphaerae bacterium]|nr:hypothetical protein [Lentisphaerota bacterium]